jgi:hypothetical protein
MRKLKVSTVINSTLNHFIYNPYFFTKKCGFKVLLMTLSKNR